MSDRIALGALHERMFAETVVVNPESDRHPASRSWRARCLIDFVNAAPPRHVTGSAGPTYFFATTIVLIVAVTPSTTSTTTM